MKELVSVIMPTYNAGHYMADSIEGVLGQTYRNLELIITDDGSDDGETLRILDAYEQRDARVKVIRLSENHGAGYARNKAIDAARGRYIAFCDSDDIWWPNKLELQIGFMKAKGCALCYSSYIIIDEDGKEIGYSPAPRRLTFSMMKRDNKIGCSTAVYDTVALGGKVLMPDIRKRQDWALFLTILRQCGVAYGLRRPLVRYRRRRGSVSSRKWGLVRYNARVYELVLGYPRWRALLCLVCCFLPAYVVKVARRRAVSRRWGRRRR